jgi:hypothetical protein
MQWLIPYAFVDDPGCDRCLATLQLPHLEQLLRRLQLARTTRLSPHTLTPPHEWVSALAVGLAPQDGKIPWAALELARSGGDPGTAGWAWVTPAHWQVGTDRIQMTDPATLQLPRDESEALMAAMAPWFAQDGIVLRFDTPQRWLARGEPLVDLACASLDRAVETDLGPWMPATAGLRRLQNEMQMLLYTHPVNDARSARGALPVNSFWVSGSGALPVPVPGRAPELQVVDLLRSPALRGDWDGWTRAWQQIDLGPCREIMAALDRPDSPQARSGPTSSQEGPQPWLRQAPRGGMAKLGNGPALSCDPVELVLCSERSALHFTPAGGGLRARLLRRFSRPSLKDFVDPS